MTTRRGMRALAVMLTTALIAPLTGCSLFWHPPPDAVKSPIDRAVEEIRQIDGVSTVSARISPRDIKDGGPLSDPSAWSADIAVKAESDVADLTALTASVEQEIESASGYVEMLGTLRLPADAGGAEATIDFYTRQHDPQSASPEDITTAVTMLRRIEGALSVGVSNNNQRASVGIRSASRWPAVVAELRGLPGFGRGLLTAATVYTRGGDSLALDAVSPGPQLVETLANVTTQPGVASLSFIGVPGDAPGGSAWRPSLRIDVSAAKGSSAKNNVERVVEFLVNLDETQTLTNGVPRPSFLVQSFSGDSRIEREGYLGLPFGSPEPDDGIVPDPVPVPPDPPEASPDPVPDHVPDDAPDVVPYDPVAGAEKLHNDRLGITSLMDEAGKLAGIHGTAETTAVVCDTGVGEQIRGSVLIPVFEVADNPDAAYDAIVSSWEAHGYHRSDRAAGTDYYSAGASVSGGPQTLSIRGGSDGITINAISECVVVG